MKLHLARNTKLLIAEDQVLAKSHMHYALEQLGFKNIHLHQCRYLSRSRTRHHRVTAG
jgi:hypothetical protein